MAERVSVDRDLPRTWAEIIDTPHPVFGDKRPDGRRWLPLSHPHWPHKGHADNTDRYYDDFVAEYGEIPGYEPSTERGYPVKPDPEEGE